MRILCSIHLYPPKHNCGAEGMIHAMNKYLQGKGHEVRVLLWQANHYKIENIYCYEGIDVFPPEQNLTETLFAWSDVVMTHLDYTQQTIGLARVFKKPVVHLIHNYSTYPSIELADRPQYIVYNSEAAKEKLNYQHESITVHPPVDWRQYDINRDPEKNQFITLINLDGNKGGKILREIATRLPEKQFLGVKGSYSEPASEGQHTDQPSNVTIMDNTPFIMRAYEQTRILIMPSNFESWGRTATEAMSSGIPVICNPTPGLKENCADAGIYVDRDDIDGWVKAIKKLDDPKEYKKASKKAKERSRELDPNKELEAFEAWIRDVPNKYTFR
jgi:glycosyltransferase involved in cell wall biosynthesis